MIKRYVIPTVLILGVFAAAGAVYEFYLKSRLAEYRQNIARMEELESRLQDLETTFEGTKPEVIVKATKLEIGPLAEAVQSRAQFFELPDVEDPELPEQGLYRFIYEEKYNERFEKLSRDAYSRNIYLNPGIDFGVQSPEALSGQLVSKNQAEAWLRRIDFGSQVTRRLIEANARAIRNIVLWPFTEERNLLRVRRVGLDIQMPIEDLVRFLDELRLEDKYTNVEAIRVRNANLNSNYEPLLDVEMVLSYADYIEPELRSGEVGDAVGGGGQQTARAMFASLRLGAGDDQNATATAQEGEPGIFGKMWKWFKRYILYMN